MAIQLKQKSKRDRTSQAQRATNDVLEGTAVTPARHPEGTAGSQQFKSEELGADDSELVNAYGHPINGVGMSKFANEMEVCLIGELKNFLRDFGTKDKDFLFGLVYQVGNASPKSHRYDEERLESRGVKENVDERGVKFMLGFIKEGKPRDAIESSLLASLVVLLLPLSQPHSGAAAVLVDEFDACGFERLTNCSIVCASQRCFAVSEFGAANCGDAQ
jgi:hypothetical protein